MVNIKRSFAAGLVGRRTGLNLKAKIGTDDDDLENIDDYWTMSPRSTKKNELRPITPFKETPFKVKRSTPLKSYSTPLKGNALTVKDNHLKENSTPSKSNPLKDATPFKSNLLKDNATPLKDSPLKEYFSPLQQDSFDDCLPLSPNDENNHNFEAQELQEDFKPAEKKAKRRKTFALPSFTVEDDRPHRKTMKPLQFWKNEKVVYGRPSMENFPVPSIKKVITQPSTPEPKKKEKNHGKLVAELEAEGFTKQDHAMIPVYDGKSGKQVEKSFLFFLISSRCLYKRRIKLKDQR